MVMGLNVAGHEKQSVIVVVLIPFREVPDRFTSQERSMMGQVPGCQLLLEMFVDTNNKVFFNCDHNNNQLARIVEYFSKSTESKVATRPPVSHIHPPLTSWSEPNTIRNTTTNISLPRPPQLLGKSFKAPGPHISKLKGNAQKTFVLTFTFFS